MHRYSWSRVAAASLCIALVGCATEQGHTRSTVPLPIPVEGLRVIYEQTNVLPPVSEVPAVGQAATRVLIGEMFSKAVSRLPEQFRSAGIRSAEGAGSTTAVTTDATRWTMVKIRPVKDTQQCYGSSCSHRLQVRVTLQAPATGQELWVTDVEEPYMVSAFAYQARYDELAGHIAKAVLSAVSPQR